MSRAARPRPGRLAGLLVLCALAGLLGACSGGGTSSSSTAAATAPATSGTASSTAVPAATTATTVPRCTPPKALPVGRSERATAFNGAERRYSVHVPPSYDGTTPLPLVVDFHGRGSNFAEQYAYSGFAPIADRDGYLLVHPDAAGDPQQWNPLGLIDPSYDDVAFVDALLTEVVTIACVDEARVYAMGMSSGGFMAGALACTRADRFAAFGAVTFEFYNDRLCGGAPPVPIVFFHGTADAVVPFRGGFTGGARRAAEAWAEHDGCDPRPSVRRVGEEVRRLRWAGCDSSGEVTLFVVEGGGHTWPGSFPVPRLGPVTDDVDASEVIADLFARHALG